MGMFPALRNSQSCRQAHGFRGSIQENKEPDPLEELKGQADWSAERGRVVWALSTPTEEAAEEDRANICRAPGVKKHGSQYQLCE